MGGGTIIGPTANLLNGLRPSRLILEPRSLRGNIREMPTFSS